LPRMGADVDSEFCVMRTLAHLRETKQAGQR
jgi:hypothetical protein